MNTITKIKKTSKNKDVVVVSRKEYESLLERQRFIPIVKLNLTEKKALEKARKEMSIGDYFTINQIKNDLGITNSKKC